MLRFIPLLLLPLLALACKPKPVPASGLASLDPDEPFAYERFRPEGVLRPAEFNFPKSRNKDPAHYRPDTTNERYLPIRYLMVSFHIMNSSDTLYPLYGEAAVKNIKEVLNATNDLMRAQPELWLKPDSMEVPALPKRLLFNLANKPGTDEPAIYEHYDDELYGYLHTGKHRNRADRGVIREYAVNKDSVLNIFIMGPPGDSLTSKTFRSPGTDGIYLGDAIKVTGWLESNRPPWELRGIVAHEIGHALTLNHAWTRDGCDDTPTHRNDYWSRRGENTGPGKTSNNLMDYSNHQKALTPCQIGRMHAAMSDINGRQRKWLLPYWCRYNPNEPVRVTKDLNWEGARDFNTDIFIRRGQTLRINNRLHLPDRGVIYVDPGARLLLGPGAIIHSDCGGAWGGIKIGVTDSGYRGEVVVDDGAILLNEQK
ncbi:MAG: hypothetical protein ACI81P_000342 [Neolewinella sp.]|jgi:hypothetical protein